MSEMAQAALQINRDACRAIGLHHGSAAAPPAGSAWLGTLDFAAGLASAADAPGALDAAPFAVPLQALAPSPFAHLALAVDGPIERQSGPPDAPVQWHLARAGGFLFVHARADARAAIGAQSLACYRALLGVLREQRCAHPLRIWNYVPHINADEGGEERYRLFNEGRRQAFGELGFRLAEGAPAACALGSVGEGDQALCVAILAAERAPMAVENPRQMSAYHYPRHYGASAPIFSRAAWFVQPGADDVLFVSGTASIVGHQSLHEGDVQAQTREALVNIQALLDERAGDGVPRPLTLADLVGRVYVRHPEHMAQIQPLLEAHGMRRFAYLQADICRAELLVEIEAEATCPHRPAAA